MVSNHDLQSHVTWFSRSESETFWYFLRPNRDMVGVLEPTGNSDFRFLSGGSASMSECDLGLMTYLIRITMTMMMIMILIMMMTMMMTTMTMMILMTTTTILMMTIMTITVMMKTQWVVRTSCHWVQNIRDRKRHPSWQPPC